MRMFRFRSPWSGLGSAIDASRPSRRLASRPEDAKGTVASRRLNRIAPLVSAERYLEIGVQKGKTLEAVVVVDRVGVDPQPMFDPAVLPSGVAFFAVPSDDYFSGLHPKATFDLVFVDGLHEYRQSYRDVIHALAHLAPRGAVLIDDVVPTSAAAAVPDLQQAYRAAKRTGETLGDWMGDVFRTALALATLHPELEARTIGDDDGRAQMLVWRAENAAATPGGGEASVQASTDRLDELSAVTFEALFARGVPSALRPGSLAAILDQFRMRDAGTA